MRKRESMKLEGARLPEAVLKMTDSERLSVSRIHMTATKVS
jgi:hypothetical protein